ncbi:MAG: hypothetical protein ACYDAC_11140 [Candidatus Dormibacteria bacterium]
MGFAASCTRAVSFRRTVRRLDELSGVSSEILTGRDTIFCNQGQQTPLFVPE